MPELLIQKINNYIYCRDIIVFETLNQRLLKRDFAPLVGIICNISKNQITNKFRNWSCPTCK